MYKYWQLRKNYVKYINIEGTREDGSVVKSCDSESFDISVAEWITDDENGWAVIKTSNTDPGKQIPSNTPFYVRISDSNNEFYQQSKNVKVTFEQDNNKKYLVLDIKSFFSL